MTLISSDNEAAETNNKKDGEKGTTANLYAKRKKLYTRVIRGQSQVYRGIVALLIYGSFFVIPWIQWGERPAVWFDIVGRQFHIFGWTFWPQDFAYLAWVLIIAAYSLFLFTTVAGRLWCGYACPQTMWTLLFIWVEDKIEGKPHKRKRLDESKLNANKVFKKLSKHIVWVAIAFVTASGFIAYFYPVRELWADLFNLDLPLAAVVGLGVFTWLTYVDAGWLREQVCIYMCPYARFQSVMYDKDTLLVSYLPEIGEPRSSVKDESQTGACIDCYRCVQVCPTGIDIRDGSQISCINCALCIDACDDVMASIGRKEKLIKFTSMNQLAGEKLHLIRPKTIAYVVMLCIMVTLLMYNVLSRAAVDVTVVRDRNQLYRATEDGRVENDYLLKIQNKTEEPIHVTLSLDNEGLVILSDKAYKIPKGEMVETTMIISTASGEENQAPASDVLLYVSDVDSGELLEEKETRFIMKVGR